MSKVYKSFTDYGYTKYHNTYRECLLTKEDHIKVETLDSAEECNKLHTRIKELEKQLRLIDLASDHDLSQEI